MCPKWLLSVVLMDVWQHLGWSGPNEMGILKARVREIRVIFHVRALLGDVES